MPNLPIKHELADGSVFEHCPNGSYKLWHADGTVTDLTVAEGVMMAVLIENGRIMKRIVGALEEKRNGLGV